MDSRGYQEVPVCDGVTRRENTSTEKDWKPFLRQLLICSGVWISYFVYGLCVGAPTVFIPQIRKENNSTAAISDEMASWLTSVMTFSGFPCVIVLSILTKLYGRKICFIISCVDTFIAFIVFYYSNNVLNILISLIMQGFFSAMQICISVVIITEYTSPKYRGLFLAIKSATLYWGIWASNAIGTFFHWKLIGLVGIILTLYLFTVTIWPESPYWLASKERYDECAASHRWLKGCDEDSEKELKSLINTQTEYKKRLKKIKITRLETIRDVYTSMTASEFYKPTLISILTGMLAVFSGKLVCTVYAIDIIRKITDNESTAYTGMLILDGITVLSMYAGCALSKCLKRRTLLLVSSAIGAILLFLISLYLYLIKLAVIAENQYVSMCLLMLFSIAISCGPLTMSSSVYGEVIPIRSRNLAMCVIATSGKLCIGTMFKIAPYLFNGFGIHGTFLFFGISTSILIGLLYKYLPETKDKTLQEIADSIKGIKRDIVQVVEAEKLMKDDVKLAISQNELGN